MKLDWSDLARSRARERATTHDVVIDDGKVRKRKKGSSKEFREKFGHTPLSPEEEIPWGGKQLMVGTGTHGALPIMNEVRAASLQLCV